MRKIFVLVVETMGLWSPFALRTLRTIAIRASLHNGLTEKLSFKNLLQQMSVKLWCYNAKLVLHRLSTLPDLASIYTLRDFSTTIILFYYMY